MHCHIFLSNDPCSCRWEVQCSGDSKTKVFNDGQLHPDSTSDLWAICPDDHLKGCRPPIGAWLWRTPQWGTRGCTSARSSPWISNSKAPWISNSKSPWISNSSHPGFLIQSQPRFLYSKSPWISNSCRICQNLSLTQSWTLYFEVKAELVLRKKWIQLWLKIRSNFYFEVKSVSNFSFWGKIGCNFYFEVNADPTFNFKVKTDPFFILMKKRIHFFILR